MTDTPIDNSQPLNSGTRARNPNKIPANIKNPDGSLQHLTKKQRSIIKRLPTSESMGSIANELHCSKGYVSQTFHLPAVQLFIKNELDAAGAPQGKIFKRIAEGLDATQEDRAGGERPDFGQRHKTAMDILKLEGLNNPVDDKSGDTVNNTSIYNIVINARKNRGLTEGHDD
jgi:hypothetical protein